jgi:hypothetical protein
LVLILGLAFETLEALISGLSGFVPKLTLFATVFLALKSREGIATIAVRPSGSFDAAEQDEGYEGQEVSQGQKTSQPASHCKIV